MNVIWDPKKEKANRLKHRVHFSDAATMFYDENALSRSDPDAVGEERFVATGKDALGQVVTVVYVYQKDAIRLISARKATKKEREYYENRI